MALMFETNEYTPAQLAKVLSEEFGHKVTAAVIRKWDNEIFEGVSSRTRGKAEARNYSQAEIYVFNAIAVLRNMGYSVKDIKNILVEVMTSPIVGKLGEITRPDMVINTGKERIILEIKGRMDKQQRAFEVLGKYLEMAAKKK